jgi:tetratricopeptide (TPR) repeat protein
LSLLALPALAQNALSPSASDDTATAPPQLRQAAPPPADASAEQLEARGDELRAQKAYADALDYYHAALAKSKTAALTHSEVAALHNKSGIAHLQMLHYKMAKKEFGRAIKLDPTYAEPHNNLGVVEYIQNKPKKAVDRYLKAIELKPGAASFHSNLGTAYFTRKQYDKASAAYLRALELDPDIFEREAPAGVSARMASPADRARFSYVIAKMYAKTGNSDRCLLYLRKALEAGYAGIDDVYKDEEFSQVRKDPRFGELMASKPVAVTN